jgi:hypothetical protein
LCNQKSDEIFVEIIGERIFEKIERETFHILREIVNMRELFNFERFSLFERIFKVFLREFLKYLREFSLFNF